MISVIFAGSNDGIYISLRRSLKPPVHSFFVFGPRGTGKSRWLADRFSGAAATFDGLDYP